MVDEFLAGQGLKLRPELLALPVAPDVAPPGSLSEEGRREWRSFLTYPQHSAFAVSDRGHYGFAYGRADDKTARKAALEHCEDGVSHGDRCRLVETQP